MARPALIRVDNRLLHGQVVQVWIPHLAIEHLVVADDAFATNEAMLAMCRLVLPPGVGLTVTSIAGLRRTLASLPDVRVLVVVRDVHDAARAAQCGVSYDRLMLGNVHAASGRSRVTEAVHLSREETDFLLEASRRGVVVEIRTLPGDVLRLNAGADGAPAWSRP